MVRNVRRIIERHPATESLRPEGPDEWAADRFTVKREVEWRDPSMLAAGITANITGMRADIIIADDVEVPNTADTADKREELRGRLHELSFIQTPTARVIYVGTPHALDTIYQTDPDHPDAFLKGFVELRLPVVDETGTYAWPEKFGPEKCLDLRARVGGSLFDSQMMLNPTALTTCILDPALIPLYDTEITYVPELRQSFIEGRPVRMIRAWWDPALAEGRGDRSILAVVITDEQGFSYIHRVHEIKVDPHGTDDNARQQCLQVARILADDHVTSLGLETNGLGRLLPGLLRRVLVECNVNVAVQEHHHRGSKADRIRQAFETRLAASRLRAHRSVAASRFFDELRDWRPDRDSSHDDAIDAVAGALLMDPVRLPPLRGGRRAQWLTQ
jgi:hypothetical protein